LQEPDCRLERGWVGPQKIIDGEDERAGGRQLLEVVEQPILDLERRPTRHHVPAGGLRDEPCDLRCEGDVRFQRTGQRSERARRLEFLGAGVDHRV
jgi:hypothetical protein